MISYAFVAMLSWWFSDGVEIGDHSGVEVMSPPETNLDLLVSAASGSDKQAGPTTAGKHLRQDHDDDHVLETVFSLSAILPRG